MKSGSMFVFGRLRSGWFGLCLSALAAWPAQGASTLIPSGAVWKYLDNGTDQGTAWQGVGFDDSFWNVGPAQLGYGDGDEATVVSFGPDQFSKYITTYFRHRFDLPGVAEGDLTLRLLRDDGAIVYINGVEVFRSNMPVGPVFFDTRSTVAVVGAEETNVFVSMTLPPSVLVAGTNVVAVEVHQVNPPSSDVSFDLELIGENIITNELPVVNVVATSPNAAEGGLASEGLSGAFTFFRTGGLDSTTEVTFALGGSAGNGIDYALLTNRITFAPGATEVHLLVAPSFDTAVEGTETVEVILATPVCAPAVPLPPGCYSVGQQFQAVVFIADFPSPPGLTLIATGSVWRYLDNGTDQGTAWRQLAFNDGIWSSGPAQLGYGEGDEATVVSFGTDPANKFITTYFRRPFNVPSVAGMTKLKARLIQDDAAVVFLNGVEVFRGNLPPGPVPFNALAIVSTENQVVDFEISPDLLSNGANLLAVEMHQQSPVSGDLSFEFSLVAEISKVVSNQPPMVAITAPTNGTAFQSPTGIPIEAVTQDPDGYANKVEFFADDVKIGEAEILFFQAPPPGEPIQFEFTWQDAPVGQYRLTTRTRDDRGAPGISAPVEITVRAATPGDSDNDGVPDDRDRCQGTAAGIVVNAEGCSIAQLCPCAGPWLSHGAYVRCVVERAWEFYRANLITALQRREFISQAMSANCGRQPGEGDVLLLFSVPQTAAQVRAEGYRYCVIAPAGRGCVIESSTDLRDWRPIETLTLTECETEKVVSPVVESSQFYRARLEP